jgi:hypothetical protein
MGRENEESGGCGIMLHPTDFLNYLKLDHDLASQDCPVVEREWDP